VSRGNGKDGALLYDKCSGKCSPRYFMEVAQDGEGFVANLDVVCGTARDKADNTFAIASGSLGLSGGATRLLAKRAGGTW
jgi:hypothetical protein